MDRMNIHKRYGADPEKKLAGKGGWLVFACVALQLTGCVKDDLYNTRIPTRARWK